jgi:hypothetical protein
VIGEREGKRRLGRHRHRWKENGSDRNMMWKYGPCLCGPGHGPVEDAYEDDAETLRSIK